MEASDDVGHCDELSNSNADSVGVSCPRFPSPPIQNDCSLPPSEIPRQRGISSGMPSDALGSSDWQSDAQSSFQSDFFPEEVGFRPQPGNHSALENILQDIGASDYLQNFLLRSEDDDSLNALSQYKPSNLVKKGLLPLELAEAFVQKCLHLATDPHIDSVHDNALERNLWMKAVLILEACAKGVRPFVGQVISRVHSRVIDIVKQDIFRDLGTCQDVDWDCGTCDDVDDAKFTENGPVALAICAMDTNGIAYCPTPHHLKPHALKPCRLVNIPPGCFPPGTSSTSDGVPSNLPVFVYPNPAEMDKPDCSSFILLHGTEPTRNGSYLTPFIVTRCQPSEPALQFHAILCPSCPGHTAQLVKSFLLQQQPPVLRTNARGELPALSFAFWSLKSTENEFMETKHGVKNGHILRFDSVHENALPPGVVQGCRYLVTDATDFSFNICGPIICPIFPLTSESFPPDVAPMKAIRTSPVGRIRDAARLFHWRGLNSVHWSGIRACRLSEHHGEFCKLFCSQTSRSVDFFSEDGARSGEQLLNMIGMCTAFSMGNQTLSIVIQKGSLCGVFECTVLSSPPETFSVVASAHDPTKPDAEKSAKAQTIKLWIVSKNPDDGSLTPDERKLPADTDVTFAGVSCGLPGNIYAGFRYQPTCIQPGSFQLLRPGFSSLFDVDASNFDAVKLALDRVRHGAFGQPVSRKELKHLLSIDPENHRALKEALDNIRRIAVESDISDDLRRLMSVEPEDHEALKLELDNLKQGFGQQGTDWKDPGVIDFRHKLCHNLLTLDQRHFDALVSCARNIFPSLSSVCSFIGKSQESQHAKQSLAEIESIVKRDIQIDPLTQQEREVLICEREKLLEERDHLKEKLGRKFDSFAPCLKKDIQAQLTPERQIGSGGQGSVYRVTDSLWGQPLAVKIFQTKEGSTSWRQELNNLTFLTHGNIVRMFYILYETLEDRSDSRAPVGYVMELMARSAADQVDQQQYTVEQLLNVFTQVASALAFSHMHGVIHFDVKPENILLDDSCSVAKLCDFGCALKLRESATASKERGQIGGTVLYMAPEAFDGELEKSQYKLCDIYSFGKTMWKLMHPLAKMKLGEEWKVDDTRYPDGLKKLVEQCTLKDSSKRPQDMSIVLQALESIQRSYHEVSLVRANQDFSSASAGNLAKSSSQYAEFVDAAYQFLIDQKCIGKWRTYWLSRIFSPLITPNLRRVRPADPAFRLVDVLTAYPEKFRVNDERTTVYAVVHRFGDENDGTGTFVAKPFSTQRLDDARSFDVEKVIRATQSYLQDNHHTAFYKSVLLSRLGLEPSIREAMRGANDVKLGQILKERPTMFGFCGEFAKTAVYYLKPAKALVASSFSHATSSPRSGEVKYTGSSTVGTSACEGNIGFQEHTSVPFTQVFVKRIREDVTDEQLAAAFVSCGNITSAVVHRDDKGNSKGFGCVNFETPECAVTCIQKFNDTDILAISDGKKISVSKYIKNAVNPPEHAGKLDAGAERSFCDAVYQLMIELERLPNSRLPVLGTHLGLELIKHHIRYPYGKAKEAKQRGLKSFHEILRDDHQHRFVVLQPDGSDFTVDLARAGSAAPRPPASLVAAHPPEHAGKLDAGAERSFCDAVYQLMIELERLPNSRRPVLGAYVGAELSKRDIRYPYGKSKEAKLQGLKSCPEILRDDYQRRFVVSQKPDGTDFTVDLARSGSAASRTPVPAPAAASAFARTPMRQPVFPSSSAPAQASQSESVPKPPVGPNDAPLQGTNLYVKWLHLSVNDDTLRGMFAHLGTVTSAKVEIDRQSNVSKGFGYVNFSTPEEAAKAITEMNGRRTAGPRPLFVGLHMSREQRFSVNKRASPPPQDPIISMTDATPDAQAAACMYYRDIEFAAQLCREFAAAESGNSELFHRFKAACETLESITARYAHLQLTPVSRLPAWPRHEALLRFDFCLQKQTKFLLGLTTRWYPHFFAMRGRRLYHSDGSKRYSDTLQGTQEYVQSNPEVDGNFCIDLLGCTVHTCDTVVNGQSFAFEINFKGKILVLASADEKTRQLCMRIIRAASSGAVSSAPQDIAAAAALTRDLFSLKSVHAVNAVLSALGKAEVQDLDLASLRGVGFNLAMAITAGYDVPSLVSAFGIDAVAASGCDVSSILRYGSSVYMTLHQYKYDDRTLGLNGEQPAPVPAGWQIAEGNEDDIKVCGARPWQSNFLVFALGDMYGTAMSQTGQKVASSQLVRDASGVRTLRKNADVLLRLITDATSWGK